MPAGPVPTIEMFGSAVTLVTSPFNPLCQNAAAADRQLAGVGGAGGASSTYAMARSWNVGFAFSQAATSAAVAAVLSAKKLST